MFASQDALAYCAWNAIDTNSKIPSVQLWSEHSPALDWNAKLVASNSLR